MSSEDFHFFVAKIFIHFLVKLSFLLLKRNDCPLTMPMQWHAFCTCVYEKALQKFRAAAKAGLAIFPVICPGYVIKDHACWWPANMPELEEYIHYFDMRDMLSSSSTHNRYT